MIRCDYNPSNIFARARLVLTRHVTENWGIAENIPQFSKLRALRKRFEGYIINTIVSIWRENMLGYLSADIICSEKRTVFRERSSRKTVSFEEQIMSKERYPSIFSRQMETIVYIYHDG